MKISVNGKDLEVADGLNVEGLLVHLNVKRQYTAVAVNREVTPKSAYEATVLHDGDGLVLDDGSVILVAGKCEALVEITAAGAQELARLAWHIGNRHTDVQVVGERLRIRQDRVLEEMLRGLGAHLTAVEAPFEPEPGAYGQDHGHGSHRHDG